MRSASMVLAVAVGLVSAAILAAGCGTQETALRAPGSSEDDSAPRRTLLAWHGSLVGGDRQQYLASFAGTEEELVLALAIFDAVQVNYRFYNAVVAKYGADAWKAFEGAGAARVHLWPREPGWTATITVVRTGNFAVGYLPRARVPMHLRQDGGRWRIDAASLVPPGVTADKGAYYLYRWVAAMEELILRVGRPETTPAEFGPRASQEAYKAKLREGEFAPAAEAVDAFLAP